ncbi:hypothetical protein GWO43_31140 [candidate division KSB1 bacterium]|nr:hypothetical protein [candidate division KSB1 bacterium]NIR73195.1 hypothetical protein [candidate division KSB1 bacterium]NIS28344.1 hypothetical protein [candidate division KSB1 bacterium]NIT75236.1 hypothetical protein [candidate division KSB1 bacterium]NIU29076.1 hypothetical protein [candidate division KSB1 bacterium]
MNTSNISLEKVVHFAKSLSTSDKVKLIKQVTSQLEQELKPGSSKPRKSLRGLWQGLDISDKDIAEARREMWQNFPREDI